MTPSVDPTEQPPPPAPANEVGEVVGALPMLARVAWFAFGALVAAGVTLAVTLKPWAPRPAADTSMPYEVFPFADNAGVCQEWVALADVETSHEDAAAVAGRLIPLLPATLRADNLRVVRAFTPGDRWTIAVDAQSGAGDATRAGAIANMMNGIPGTGVRFRAVYYSARTLYDSARVLCMPRQSVTHPSG